MPDEAFLQQTYDARERYARTLGVPDPDFLAPLINPSFMGGPAWPDLRQAWRVIRRGGETIVLSDGLSDPFTDEDPPSAGFALEVLAHSADALRDPLQGSWLFDLAYQVSQQCADHGGVRDLVDQLGVLSLELPATDVLAPAANEDGSVGVLLGLDPPDFPTTFDLPAGDVKVVTAKLLWPTELAHAAQGKAARAELAQRFAADGTHHRSSLKRKPVV